MHDMEFFRMRIRGGILYPSPSTGPYFRTSKQFLKPVNKRLRGIGANVGEQPAVAVDLHPVVRKHHAHEPRNFAIAGFPAAIRRSTTFRRLLPGGGHQQYRARERGEIGFEAVDEPPVRDPEYLVKDSRIGAHFASGTYDSLISDSMKEKIPRVPVEEHDRTVVGLYCLDVPGPVLLLVIPGLLMPADLFLR